MAATSNFEFLQEHDPIFYQLGHAAERAFSGDPNTTLIKLRQLHVVGYASGLNENLQRSFLKNAVQYFDVMSESLTLGVLSTHSQSSLALRSIARINALPVGTAMRKNPL
ncbi:MAG: hypothetical protein L3J28_10295 [Candidatus Polarisedimenticolaceae bacterium]|nr:hypothetical protein [Candidatus Polarisedimenticolaceae bacterium]